MAVLSDLHMGMLVVRELLALIAKQKTVYCVTGNRDEVFRRFVGFQTGQFKIVNKVVLTLDGKKTWIFHGDVFDLTMHHSKWLAMLGGKGYDHVVCGHIHQPADRMVVTLEGSVRYLNSGGWVENCTALECHCGIWRLHRQVDAPTGRHAAKSEVRSTQELFQEMLAEMNEG